MKNLRFVEENMLKTYEENAQEFDRQRSKNLFEEKWLNKFSELIGPSGEVLDIGCGAGEPIAKYFIEKGFSITGADFSSEMIKIARKRFPKQSWIIEDMRTLNLKREFDGLIAWNSFFHLNQEDQRKAIPLFCKLVKDEGVLMMTVGPEEGEVLGKVNNCDVYHSSLSEKEYRSIFEKMNFDIIEFMANDSECNGHSILLAKKR
ncbi:MAG: SAM-dependent methyltransferase [Halobacteriovorax sp.]|nr:SAM-dependent methyltransferase [Halobacteriovorax sp.]|tara:strand:- start:35018 stop:35629 length:612 start_codon:yes stop_codon:yes gene_type:complete